MGHKEPLGLSTEENAASSGSLLGAESVPTSKTFKEGAIHLSVRSDYKKPTWFCRLKIPGAKGYIFRSTRTADDHAAYAFAENLYNQMLVRSLSGSTPNAKRLGIVLEAYTRHLEPDHHRESIHNKLLLIKRITPFLRSKTVDEVDTALISAIISELTQLSSKKRLSPNTVRRISSDLKHFLNWAVDQGYLTAVPRFPKVAGDKARRAHFDDADWRKLVRYLREFVKVENRAVRRDRMMLRDYVLILGNTGIRIGEAETLKWRDLRQIDGDEGKPPNIVLSVSGKTGNREVIARTADVKTYFKRILELRQAELATEGQPNPAIDTESLIFCHPDGSPIKSFKKSFRSLLKAAGVEKDSQGNVRTLYSLRHTYATFRLHSGVNHYTLAKNMGTSVTMLEQYYGHTSNITSASELTKSGGKRQKGGNTAALDWLK